MSWARASHLDAGLQRLEANGESGLLEPHTVGTHVYGAESGIRRRR
jgi:hypothetical protein